MFNAFVSKLIYGTGAEALITPNHRDFLLTPGTTGTDWLAHHVDGPGSMLGLFEGFLATNHLPPLYPWDGHAVADGDPFDIINSAYGYSVGVFLEPTGILATSEDQLGSVLRFRLIDLPEITTVWELNKLETSPYSYRFWGYLKWASLLLRRFRGELVDFNPPKVFDRDGTILSALPFLTFVNDAHWHWHDFSGHHHGLPFMETSPIGAITPGYSSPVGQRARANATTHHGLNEEFLKFHRDHIKLFHTWLARTGQPEQRAINMLSVYDGFGALTNVGFPPAPTGTPSTWVETYNRPWVNDEADTGSPRLFDFATPADLADMAMGDYHAAGHNANTDIAHPFQNNVVPRFFAWHLFLDNQWYFRAPRFSRWNAATGLRERVFRPLSVSGGAPWSSGDVLTIVRDPAAPADVVAPLGAVGGISLTSGEGTLRMEFVAVDTYGRLLRARFRAEVFDDTTGPTALETVNVERTVGPGGDFALGANFTVDFAFTAAFLSNDPGRLSAQVGFANSRIRVTGTLAPDDGTDAAFTHEDYFDIDLVKEQVAPALELYLNLSSFSENQVASQVAEVDGSKRFHSAILVTVQDKTERAAPIVWPTTMVEELKGVLARPIPAAGLFDDAAHAPNPELWQPAVDLPFTGLRVELASGPVKEDPALPDHVPQRYTYTYDVVFEATNDAFSGLAVGGSQLARLRFTVADRAGNSTTENARITLLRDANPYMIDGDPAWLSRDTRVFRIFEGESLFGETIDADQPIPFIGGLLNRLNDSSVPAATRDALFDSLPTFAGQDSLEFSTEVRAPSTAAPRKIYNFALARVRLQGTDGALQVRAFFRLFTYSGPNLVFEDPIATPESGGYRLHTAGTRHVPLLGFGPSGEVISIPFFAVDRVASSLSMRDQPEDTPNVRDFDAGIAGEQIAYFGAYLDINQDGARLPAAKVTDPTRIDGGFTAAEIQPIRTTIRDAHQCMVVELGFDGDPTHAGDTPFSSDNLAQRNLTILKSDNPGSPITRTVEHSFSADTRRPQFRGNRVTLEARGEITLLTTRRDALATRAAASALSAFPGHGPTTPTHGGVRALTHSKHVPPVRAPKGQGTFAFDEADWPSTGGFVDELMFVWNGLPKESRVELYLPAVRAEMVVNLRNLRHAPRDVRILDEHRLLLVPNGVTYVPLPNVPSGQVAGVVTVTLPEGVKHGQGWRVDVFQLQGGATRGTGAFQLDIRVERDVHDLAEAERRLLEVLFERRSLLARHDRWRPILDRRVATARARARAFAERAGVNFVDPTQWLDANGKARDLQGPRLRVVVSKIEIVKDYDPWIKGRGEIVFVAKVESSDNGGQSTRTRLPERGVFKIGDTPGHNVIEFERTLFTGHASTDLRIEIVGTEKDLLDPDDWMGKCARVLTGEPAGWFGEYGPVPGRITPEDVGPWRIWYRIERGGT